MSANTFTFASSRPNWFGTLLHKEWRQVRSGVLCAIAGLLAFQVMLNVLLNSGEKQPAIPRIDINYSFLFFIANGAAPILAMLIANLSIAQERQLGTWSWSSTLPATPWQSFAAKLFVWFVVSIISVLLLTLIAANMSGFEFSDYSSLSGRQLFEQSTLGLLLGFELYFLICIAVFFVEPLIGLCLAAAVVAVTHFSFLGFAGYFDRLFSTDDVDVNLLGFFTVFGLHSLLIVILGLVSFRVYRWSWGAGHFWTWSETLASLARRSAVIGDNRVWTVAELRKPSKFMAMFWLEWAGGLKVWAILLAIVGMLALAIDYVAIKYDKDPEFILWFSPLFFLFFVSFGVSIFGKDRWRNRGLFLADRGITNHAFSAKMVSAVFFIFFFIVAAWLHFVFASTPTNYFAKEFDTIAYLFVGLTLWFLFYFFGLFQLAMIAGATFRNPMIAFLIATISYYLTWILIINATTESSRPVPRLIPIFCVAATFALAKFQLHQHATRGRVSTWPYLLAMSMVFFGFLFAMGRNLNIGFF